MRYFALIAILTIGTSGFADAASTSALGNYLICAGSFGVSLQPSVVASDQAISYAVASNKPSSQQLFVLMKYNITTVSTCPTTINYNLYQPYDYTIAVSET